MAQIQESQYAVMRVNKEDIDLIDLAFMGGVSVETKHRDYNDEMTSRIEKVSPGDILQAQIQSEDVLQPNAIWRFLEFNVVGHDPGWSWS
ncbi:hypothetical protein [Halovivax ruber]|uniref:hypothetical protein n=1 Tax=Halovivax ruber TaxID=387341 RepID=UPI0011E53758|nr:hypothetical protein [Halovivax ruber]